MKEGRNNFQSQTLAKIWSTNEEHRDGLNIQ